MGERGIYAQGAAHVGAAPCGFGALGVLYLLVLNVWSPIRMMQVPAFWPTYRVVT